MGGLALPKFYDINGMPMFGLFCTGVPLAINLHRGCILKMPPPDIITISILRSQHSKKPSQDLDSIEKPFWASDDSSFPCTLTLCLVPLVMIGLLQPGRIVGSSLSGIFILREYLHLLFSWLVYSNCRELFQMFANQKLYSLSWLPCYFSF